MSLSAGTKLGTYEIVSSAGAGGMGEVYRARDSRLEREVAIKLLAAEFSADPHRLARFQQEARSASALNHPNIITVHDIGTLESGSYIVMELVEGRTIRELLQSGPLPLKKALQIAAQVADGLAKAHEAGITHRDIKPENVMVSRDGFVKILDFGLAKPVAHESAEQRTLTVGSPATHPGTVLGTVAYMSPEQARGEPADFRSDQFSFGSVLYEMLTGKRPFSRESPAQTMAAIIEDEAPPVSELNPRVPLPVRWIVERCLAKDPHDRYASTRDLARDLQSVRDHLSEASSTSAASLVAPPTAARPVWLPPLLWTAAGALLAALVAGGLFLAWRPEPPSPAAIRTITFSGRDSGPSISPDARMIAFSSTRDGVPRIWVKQVAGGTEVPLTDGPDDTDPRYSPDGTAILFTRVQDGQSSVFRIPSVGGQPRRIIAGGRSADWSPDGTRIAFIGARDTDAGGISVLSVAAADGTAVRELHSVTGMFLNLPRWSPDGQRIAVIAIPFGTAGARQVGIQLVSLDGKVEPVQPPAAGGSVSSVAWNGDGRSIIYGQVESSARAAFSSTPLSRIWLQDVGSRQARVLLWVPAIVDFLEIMGNGRLLVGTSITRVNLRRYGIGPKPAEPLWLTRGSSIDRQPIVTPDGKALYFTSNRSGNLDIWAIDLVTNGVRRITDHPAEDWDPALITASGALLFSSNRGGHFEVWTAEADGSGARQVSNDGFDAENPTATPAGDWIVYSSGAVDKRGIWKVKPDGSDATHLLAANSAWPEVSPDGKHVVFTVQRPAGNTVEAIRLRDGGNVFRTSGFNGTGRARFSPDGCCVGFLTTEGLMLQDFRPGTDTRASRRLVVPADSDYRQETFALAPDGGSVVVGLAEGSLSIMTAEGLTGVQRKTR